MSCAHAMTWEQQVISRCTRDGHVLWPHVAAQLGVSVDVARSRLDPSYMRAHIWAPSREPQPEMLEIDTSDINDRSSPYPKETRVQAKILGRLAIGSASAEDIAAFIGHGVKATRTHLSWMKNAGLVRHTDPTRKPYTWTAVGQLNPSVAGAKA